MTRYILFIILASIIISIAICSAAIPVTAQGPIDGAVATLAVATEQARQRQAALAATQQAYQVQAGATRQAIEAQATQSAIEAAAQAAQLQAAATRSALDITATIESYNASAAATATANAAEAARLVVHITATAQAVDAAGKQSQATLFNVASLFLLVAIIALVVITIVSIRRSSVVVVSCMGDSRIAPTAPVSTPSLPSTRIATDPSLAARIAEELEMQ